MIDIPVAFLIFNRPDLTERVFEAIAQAKPEKLLVVADGPRFPGEAEKCERARAVIERVDWNCEVLKNYSDVNLGCGRRVSSGLNWVFDQCEEAIILEDDCLPTASFFPFCETLLETYRDDERIMAIGGFNFQPSERSRDYSYYFSHYCHVWGWATWRRAWQHYDVDMKMWPQFSDSRTISSVFPDPVEREYWRDTLGRTVASGAAEKGVSRNSGSPCRE